MVVCVAAVSVVKKRCQGEVTVRLECALFGVHSIYHCMYSTYMQCVWTFTSFLCAFSSSSQQMVDPSEQFHPHSQVQYTDGEPITHTSINMYIASTSHSMSLHLCPCHIGYSYHPRPSDFSSQHNLEAYYHRLSAEHISNKMGPNGLHYDASPPPPPPDLQPIIDKTAEYVARNSEEFERTVLEKHCGDPKFGFLNPWNKYYPYYKLKLQQNKEKAAEAALATIEKDFQSMQREATLRGEKIQKLSQSGTVSFKLQPKKVNKILEMDVADFDAAAEEEEEEEEGTQSDGKGQSGSMLDASHAQQHSYQAGQEDGHTTDLDRGQMSAQHYPEEYVHYSSEGTYYYPSDNGEVEEEHGEEPAAKRTKTDDGNTVVMDNKVQVNILLIMERPSLMFISSPSSFAGVFKSSESCIGHLVYL